MSKAKKRPVIQSDSEDSDTGDLDQELLSLASAAKRPRPASARSSSSGSSSEAGSDDEWTLGSKISAGVKKKVKGKGGGGKGASARKLASSKKTASSSNSSDDEEDGELQVGPQSTSSSSSSGSESNSSSSESLQFDDGLDDELVGDEEDRKRLAQMTEAEREQEMYNRYEKRQAMQARFEIQRKLRRERKAKKRQQKDKEDKQKKMQSMREKRRMKEDNTKSRAIVELKAKRTADKQRKAEEERQQQKREPLKPSEVFSSGSDEESSSSSSSPSYTGDSDDDAGGRSLSGLRASAPKFISTLEELNKIKLSRYRLEKWVHMPFFDETVVGCFVRIGIGAHEGRMVYRVCEIVSVQETPKIYTMGSTKTNKGLRLRHGLQERVFRMEYISNSPFTEAEFSKWTAEMEKRGMPLPTTEFVQKVSKRIEKSRDFSLKDEDIDRIIQEKQKFRKNPTNYAMRKSRLMREKELAEQEGDTDRSRHLAQQLEELEERAEQLDKQRTKGLSAISYINERNRQGNVARAELALKEELAAAGEKKEDPFTRRKCQPTLVTLSRETAVEGTSQLLNQLAQATTDEDKEAIRAEAKRKNLLSPTTPNGQMGDFSAALLTPDGTQLSSTPAPPKPELAASIDDPFSAHNFDIQIDLPSQPEGPSVVKVTPKATPAPKHDGPRRSLNLADYKKRRGLI